MLKEFNVADSKVMSSVSASTLHKLPPPKLAWSQSEDNFDAKQTPSVSSSQDKFVCEVLIRRSQDEDCMVSKEY